MPANKMASNYLAELVDKTGRTMKIEMRADGYFSATKMCDSAKKKWNDYWRNNRTQEFLLELSSNLQQPVSSDEIGLVVCKKGGVHPGTWVHRKVAINLASWISPKFEVLVTDIADRYLTGQITTEESKAAAAQVAQLLTPLQISEVANWNKQRLDGKQATKQAALTLQVATGNKAGGYHYARMHNAVNWAATGKTTKVLRKELGIKKATPRDRMATPQLSMVAYVEGMSCEKIGEKRRELQADVDPETAVCESGKLAHTAHEFTKTTGGHDVPMLACKPPTMEQVAAALGAQVPNKRQRLVLEKAAMNPLLALPAPDASGSKPITSFFQKIAVPVPVPAPVPELDLYD